MQPLPQNETNLNKHQLGICGITEGFALILPYWRWCIAQVHQVPSQWAVATFSTKSFSTFSKKVGSSTLLQTSHLVSNLLFSIWLVPIIYAASRDHQEMWKQQCLEFFHTTKPPRPQASIFFVGPAAALNGSILSPKSRGSDSGPSAL